MRPPARRVDANHYAVAQALRDVGAFVMDLHTVPGGLDLLVAYRGRWVLLEVKDGAKPPSARQLTHAEQCTITSIRFTGAPVYVVSTEDEALRAIGAIV